MNSLELYERKSFFSRATDFIFRRKANDNANAFHHYGTDGGYGSNPFWETFINNIFGRFMGTKIDYKQEVGDLTQSSLIMAAVNWLGGVLPEAPLQVIEKKKDKTFETLEDHELCLLLENPNPYFTGEEFWIAFALSWLISGNVYWYKVRNAMGKVIQLWSIPHFLIEPRYPVNDDTQFISYYAYQVNGIEYQLDPNDVVHFRHGIDPANTRLGLSKVASVLREIFSDNEAANYAALLMKNCGVPPFVISPKETLSGVNVNWEKVRSEFVRKTTGDEKGKPIVNSIGVNVEKLAFTPDEMNLAAIRRVPEERVASVLNIPAIVLGFGAGLERSTYSNFKEAREAAYESHVIPLQRIICAKIRAQLLNEFDKTGKLRVKHDLSNVRVLQDDQNKLYQRVAIGYKSNLYKRNVGLNLLNLPIVDESENVYYSETAKKSQKDEKINPKEDTLKDDEANND